jgi:hypothetical protein
MVYLYERRNFMISDLEKLSTGLTKGADRRPDEAQRLADRIKSDPKIQRELARDGQAQITNDAGRTFVIRRKVAAASGSSTTGLQV